MLSIKRVHVFIQNGPNTSLTALEVYIYIYKFTVWSPPPPPPKHTHTTCLQRTVSFIDNTAAVDGAAIHVTDLEICTDVRQRLKQQEEIHLDYFKESIFALDAFKFRYLSKHFRSQVCGGEGGGGEGGREKLMSSISLYSFSATTV